MSFADNPMILRTLAPQPSPDPDSEPRKRLFDELFKMRERAATLANEIHRDLPDFTVHDITHLDALWEMADLIAGPDYPLNPLEAFALGAVFLLHDLGLSLAAWPGGLAELKKGPGWQDALSTYLRKHLERIPTAEEFACPPPEIERMAVQERLRALHAENAEQLALASWRHKGGPEYHLIEDPDLRQAIGPLLGKIAHSHWWPVSRLGNEFGTVLGALSNCPRDWTLDPLKLAVLLRTSDAAHLDERRAPGFLIALRRPEGFSEAHWQFQNHLLKPRVEADRLVYTTARPFLSNEIDAWWLCEETLRMVDREFNQADALLADLHRFRLRVRSVAGTESPQRLSKKYIEVDGWSPVDARLHVSNVVDLARKLGGEQLYGDDPVIPLRELIQNASDAVRARRLLENRSDNWGRVTVRIGRDDQGPWVEVEDTGVGMSEMVLSGPLLDFGTTYWGSALMREEHEGLWAKGFEPTGRFGVGFFSAFMWGNRVRVTTRRFKEDAQSDTRILEFWTGPEARPLIRPAKRDEQLQDGGTCVRVWLDREPSSEGGLLQGGYLREKYYQERKGPLSLRALCAGLAPALDVDLYVDSQGESRCVVAASDWLIIKGSELLVRINLGESLGWFSEECGPLLRKLRDSKGNVLGRASIGGSQYRLGLITVGGLVVGHLNYAAGIFQGLTTKIARDAAEILVGRPLLARWASQQAVLIHRKLRDPWVELDFSNDVIHCGGDPGLLPIALLGDTDLFDFSALANWKDAPKEIVTTSGLTYSRRDSSLYPNVFTIVVDENVFKRALARAWGCESSEVVTRRVEDYEYEVGRRPDGLPIYGESVTIFSAPE
jgi:hypothetical protein